MIQPRVESKRSERSERIAFRVEQQDAQAAQRVADRLFEGNVSMLARMALRQYVVEHDVEAEVREGAAA